MADLPLSILIGVPVLALAFAITGHYIFKRMGEQLDKDYPLED